MVACRHPRRAPAKRSAKKFIRPDLAPSRRPCADQDGEVRSGSPLNLKMIRMHQDEILRLAASIKQGTATASLILCKLGSYQRQNGLAAALLEAGWIERTLFILTASRAWNYAGASMPGGRKPVNHGRLVRFPRCQLRVHPGRVSPPVSPLAALVFSQLPTCVFLWNTSSLSARKSAPISAPRKTA